MASTPTAHADETTGLYLVTLSGPGTAGYRGDLSAPDYRTTLVAEQDATLARLGVDEPTYRWTAALNGFAAELTAEQASQARSISDVVRVEHNSLRRVAGHTAPAAARVASPTTGTGGKGTVIGVIDTGVSPGTPALGVSTTLGRLPATFSGSCEPAQGWSDDACNDKIVAASWFVEGFGASNLRSGASLSPRDDSGHGTQVASVAAGNSDVTALASGDRLGTFSGAAPDARLAVYKACWSAPDPEDDGCATADLVSAVDRAVADRVDVLNLSVASSPGTDTLDLALLGAAERDIVVTTAAGNSSGRTGYQQPWVTTVAASSGPDRTGALSLPGQAPIPGILTAQELPRAARVVLGGTIPAPGHRRSEARLCIPGSLDAARASDAIVVCARGRIARVDKSSAVDLADGVGMVLVNAVGEELSTDFHAVPTLHVKAAEGTRLRRAVRATPRLEGRLVHTPGAAGPARVMPWSATGSPRADVAKPDLAAPGFGLLAASTPAADGSGWALLSGTSGAAAKVSGLAARLRSAHPGWSANRVRSALMTSARSAAGQPGALKQGAGIVKARTGVAPGLVYDLSPTAYRRALKNRSDYSRLNLPSVQRRVPARGTVVTRRVTNVGHRPMYYSSGASGFDRHQVSVRPAAIKIAPGETRSFRIRATRAGTGAEPDSGWVTWRGANGTRVRIPVVLTR
ncbi:S8 family serine peptidase [Nocardioides sp. JQ2195]|uniref:S8 family serine peptidase n=1 Tax=Nocardioides sp. JQ2195 TaxID=2592334 RepID=UPI00143E1CD0|nr:S8 family serine peptidase [Nocardioides sp. JQ2195]QIX25736.1 S8 family serine peptidase [Nocardioides sp. JQ2195]